MKNYIIITLFIFTFSNCKSGINSLDRLGWYFNFVPKSLQVEQFYETPSPSMDIEYMWKIKIEDNKEYKKFEEQFTQDPANVIGVNTLSEVPVFPSHPDWWKDIDFKEGDLYQYRVEVVGSKGMQIAHIFVLKHNKSGYLYIQAF